MKILIRKFNSYKDRRLRERCVKYASLQPAKKLEINELAFLLYEYIKNGTYEIRI